ncbi:MAG: T9SS type A sorting domain-containing protein, partial [Calditrichota bacterium]
IVVDPYAIEDDLFCGEISEHVVNIANEGDAELRYEVVLNILEQPEGQDNERPWIVYDPVAGRIAPHQNCDMFVTINSMGFLGGDYEAILEIHSNDPVHPVVEVLVHHTVWGAPYVILQWSEDWGFPDRLDFNLAIEEDLYSFHEYRLPITIINFGTDDLEITDIRCETAEFRAEPQELMLEPGDSTAVEIIFCAEEPGLYESNLTIISNAPRNDGEDHIPVRAVAREDPPQIVALSRGWNMISTNRIPPQEMWVNDRIDVVRMLEQLSYREDNGDMQHQVIIFKDERGQFYTPQWNFCNIPFWNLTEGYQVKVDADCELNFEGELIPFDTDIPISRGWNLIAYFPDYELAISNHNLYALRSIVEHFLMLKDEMGHFCHPDFGFPGFPNFRPGEGYQVFFDANVILNYPPPRERVNELAENSPLPQPKHFTAPLNTGRNMSLLITGVSLDNAMKDITGCELQVHTLEGLGIGASVLDAEAKCGIPVWGDDPTTDQTDGAREGEALGFRLWDGSQEITLTPTWIEGEGLYRTDGFAVASLTAKTPVADDFSLTVSPNPFNSGLEVEYRMPFEAPINIDIVDFSGRSVAEHKVLSPSNQGCVYFNASAWPTGMYLIRVQVADWIKTAKVLCLK